MGWTMSNGRLVSEERSGTYVTALGHAARRSGRGIKFFSTFPDGRRSRRRRCGYAPYAGRACCESDVRSVHDLSIADPPVTDVNG